MNKFFNKVAYVFSSNILSTVFSIITVLIMPKYLSDHTEQYGYIQLYLLYSGYIGLLHLGWCDGIFLKIGGKKYNELDKKYYTTQFWMLVAFEIIISLFIGIISNLYFNNMVNKTIMLILSLNIPFKIIITMLTQILHGTLRIKEYAFITIINRFTYLLLVCLVIFLNKKEYYYFIICDLGCNIMTSCFLFGYCKDIVLKFPKNIKLGIKQAINNIKIGYNLLIVNLINGLVPDIIRVFVIFRWGISEFGKLSLSFKLMNFILIFINSVSLVLYPTLRRIKEEDLSDKYNKFNEILMIIIWGILIFYYPMKLIMSLWLPQYKTSIEYMAILLPYSVYVSKYTLLILTYMKVLRYEKIALRINIISMIISLLTTYISVNYFSNLDLALILILLNKVLCCIWSEKLLNNNISIKTSYISDILMPFIFIIMNYYFNNFMGFIGYMLLYIIYVIYIKKYLRGAK